MRRNLGRGFGRGQGTGRGLQDGTGFRAGTPACPLTKKVVVKK